ncbi:uncharacterized protein LOC116435244 isoform X4 [Nomia melanderi]|uniref:uncharacterized protein LOC116435244 isoform X4 n=1 Tax=Nomia melanderi TaxID=2448451 RepID=UPI003FCE3F3B
MWRSVALPLRCAKGVLYPTKVVQYLGGHYVVELLFFLVYTPRLGRRRGRADISTSTAYVGKLKMHSGKLRSQNSKT